MSHKVRVVVRVQEKPKPYYPSGHVGDSSDLARGLGCLGFFVAFAVIIVLLNLPAV